MRHLDPRRGVAAIVAAAALGAPLIASHPAAATADVTRSVASSDAAPRPTISWAGCGAALPGLECARLRVPLDYDSPGGDRISLALVKRPADNPAARIGSLLVNPGGPGGSGVDFVAQAGDVLFTPEVRAAFDLVGFDPRGVAGSTQLRCFATAEDQLAVLAPVAFPVTRAEEARWVAGHRAVSEACDRRGGPIIDHMSTANVARDMDQIRLALGEARLSFVGYSYGSVLGATYANLFPSRVRAVVIDGVVDPVSWTLGRGDQADTVPVFDRLLSNRATYETFQQFLALCDTGGSTCAFSTGDPRQRFDRLARRLLREPAQLPDGSGGTITVTYADLVVITLNALYSTAVWPDLAVLLADLEDATNPARAGATLQLLLARLRAQAAPYEQVYEGLAGVTCSDGDNPEHESAWARAARQADQRSPYFGRPWTWITSICASWPGADHDRYTGPWNRRSAAAVLVVGTRYDPATRYQNAVTTARLLGRARLLSVHAWGHTSLFTSTCADEATADYLLTQTLPPPGTTCQADSVPFASAAAAGPAAGSARTAAASQLSGLARPSPRHLPPAR